MTENGADAEDDIGTVQPVEIEDEYKLALETADVDDESLLEQPGDLKFSITSYGADYTVHTILYRMESATFYIPPFQRRFVWSQRHASRFIESLLMGLPVPGIFLYRDVEKNQHLVVDGQQRLRTLQYFFSGTFLERKFRLVGVRDEWDGKSYEELESADKLRLSDSIIHSTIFQQDEPKDTQKSLYFVFERINSGGIRLSPQEIRNCINDGPLLAAVREMNEDPNWRKVFGVKKNPRLKDQELILRFIAMRERSSSYARPMRDFLNSFTADNEGMKIDNLTKIGKAFRECVKACWDANGREGFRPNRSLNAAVFEAVMIGVSHRLDTTPGVIDTTRLHERYSSLIDNSEFSRACERATADEETVRTRHRLAIAAFSDIETCVSKSNNGSLQSLLLSTERRVRAWIRSLHPICVSLVV